MCLVFHDPPKCSRRFGPDDITTQCPYCFNEVLESDISGQEAEINAKPNPSGGGVNFSAMYSDIDSVSTPNTDWEAAYFPPLDNLYP